MTDHEWADDSLNKTWNCLYFGNDHHFGKDHLRMHHNHPKSRILLDNICWFPIYFDRDDIIYSPVIDRTAIMNALSESL